jgi:hypothetical protein
MRRYRHSKATLPNKPLKTGLDREIFCAIPVFPEITYLFLGTAIMQFLVAAPLIAVPAIRCGLDRIA